MPGLDMSEALTDPLTMDRLTAVRRRQSISSHGRVRVSTKRFPFGGVVNMAGPDDLERLDDNQRTGRVLSIVTKFPMRATSPGFQPDIAQWRGDSYLVHTCDPYPQYGTGFYQVLAGSIDSQDKAPPMKGQEDFSDPSNSSLLGVH